MVKNLGKGIAEAQYELDKVSIRIAQLMSGFKEDKNGKLVPDESMMIQLQDGGTRYSLLDLGFTPTFYQFVDTLIELKMAISMQESHDSSTSAKGKAGFLAWSASVSASYAQKFQYTAEGSSLMRTKLVTVPTPIIFSERLKELSKNKADLN